MSNLTALTTLIKELLDSRRDVKYPLTIRRYPLLIFVKTKLWVRRIEILEGIKRLISYSGGEVANIVLNKYGAIDYEWGIKSASTDFVCHLLCLIISN